MVWELKMTSPLVSIIIPVRNAESIIGECLDNLRKLDYPPERYEIIVADSLSTDRTLDIARKFGAKIVTTPKRSVCAGRNAGFEIARGYLVAFSDADCIMKRDWLKNAIKYFSDERVGGVGGPNLVPSDDGLFSHAVDVLFAYAYYLTGAGPVRILDHVVEAPSYGSNTIFRREALERVMPVSEELIEGEDIEMNNLIAKLGYTLLYVPDVIVWHKRRCTPRSWLKQMYGYGIGRFLAGRRNPSLFHYMHILAGMSIILVLSLLLYGIFVWPRLLGILAGIGVLLTVCSFLMALWDKRDVRVALVFPLVACLAVLGWSAGFLRAWLAPVRK
jgi:cellulose synthase/poly-beta-1,6-N-acetylglucosamine synthase-like glycosyltransferase